MTKKILIEFPCHFPIKVVGVHSDDFFEEIRNIAVSHFPDLTKEKMTCNTSKNKNYLAITIEVYAQNQKSLDDLYRQLSKHPLVKMVL